MKRFLSVLFLVFAVFVSYGQNVVAENHLEFMGISIDGSLDNFVEKLEGKGFTLQSDYRTEAVLEGKFTGKAAKIFVYSTPKTSTVCRVAVKFENQGFVTWDMLELQYFESKKLLINKYGEPISVNEEFLRDNVDGASEKLYELKKRRCKYNSLFMNDERSGSILVAIIPMDGVSEPCVTIAYTDNMNMEVYDKECQEDI